MQPGLCCCCCQGRPVNNPNLLTSAPQPPDFVSSFRAEKCSHFISAATGLSFFCGFVASVQMKSLYSNSRKLPLQCDGCERNYCCLLSLHKKKVVVGGDLSTMKTHWGERDCCLCSSLLIAVKCPHSLQRSAGRFGSSSC